MNRQQALDQLRLMQAWHEDNGDGPNADYDAICYAIGVIEAQPDGMDTLIKALEQEHKKLLEMQKAQPEIIRCKDCKHYKEWESEFTPNAVVTQCMADNFPIRKAIPDGWFCAGAERRTDEE